MILLKNFTMKMVKINFIYERPPSNIILIENTKLFYLFWVCVCVYITYQIKKCVYMCLWGVVLINILTLQLGTPDKNTWLRPSCAPKRLVQCSKIKPKLQFTALKFWIILICPIKFQNVDQYP